MKRKAIFLASALALVVGAYLGSTLWAQQPTPQAPPTTRVAVVNMGGILKGYAKTKQFEKEQDDLMAPWKKQADALKQTLETWEKAAREPNTTAENKEKWAAAIRNKKRELEDLGIAAEKEMQKKTELQIVQLYQEIEDAVKRYSVSNGFHLVVNTGETMMESERYSPANIRRKMQGTMQTGCMLAVYYTPGLDITADIVNNLNAGLRR